MNTLPDWLKTGLLALLIPCLGGVYGYGQLNSEIERLQEDVKKQEFLEIRQQESEKQIAVLNTKFGYIAASLDELKLILSSQEDSK